MDLLAPVGPVYQAGTLSGNPLAMTAGIWCLDRLTPKLYRDLATLGTRLAAGLGNEQLAEVGGVARPCRGLGDMQAQRALHVLGGALVHLSS